MATYRIEFGPAWPVPPLTVDTDDVNVLMRAVAKHAIPYLKPVLAEKGHPEYADCFFHTSKDRTVGQFMWLDFATGNGARFCPARITTA